MSTARSTRVKRTLLAGLAATATVGGALVSLGANTAQAAPVVTQSSGTTLTPVARPPMARPGYLASAKDPAFGTTITRVSDHAAFGTTYRWPRNTYSTSSAWNSDGTRLLLGYGDPGWLLDGKTFRYTGKRLSGSSSGVWSNTNPDTFYSVSGNQFTRTNVSTGATTVVRTFSGFTNLTISNGEGSPANDDRTLVLVASGGGSTSVISYDPVGNVVLGTKSIGGAGSRLDWAANSQSGRYITLSWFQDGATAGSGVELYDRSMRPLRQLTPYSEHSDFGYDSAGQEVYVTIDYTSGANESRMHLTTIRLADGKRTTVLRTDWVGTHVSCRNLRRPGWCYVSDAVADRPSRTTGGYDEVFAVKLDGSGTVQRFAHARQSAGIPYDWQTMAVPSRDGSRVLFSNDWSLGTGSPSYAYVVTHPGVATAPAAPPAKQRIPSPRRAKAGWGAWVDQAR